MKKNVCILIVLLAALPVAPLCAVDLGFNLDSLTQLSGAPAPDPSYLTESLRLSASLSGKAGPVFSYNASGYGNIGYASFGTDHWSFGGNLDRLELAFLLSPAAASSQFKLLAGRLRISDPGSFLGLSRMDGLSARFSAGQLDIGADAGYTGLLSSKDARITLSAPDAADYADENAYFAPPRLYAAASVKLAEIFLRQDIVLHAAMQSDLRAGSTDKVNSQYGQLFMEGPLGSGFTYGLAGLYEFIQCPDRAGAEAKRQAAGALARLSWANPAALGSSASITADWSSGKSGALGLRAPIGASDAGDSYSVAFASMLRYKFEYSVSPMKGLSAGLTAAGFMRAGPEEPADSGYLAGSANTWLGEEGTLRAEWSPLSDLRLSLKGSCFLPAQGITYEADAPLRWSAALGLSLDL